jgi:hypothetical protein
MWLSYLGFFGERIGPRKSATVPVELHTIAEFTPTDLLNSHSVLSVLLKTVTLLFLSELALQQDIVVK